MKVVRSYSLAQWPALADGDLVTLLNTESWRNVGGEVLVALLVTGVLGDEVEVLAADDEGTVHLGGDDGTGQDTATDRDKTGEGALLVCTVLLVFRCRSIFVSMIRPRFPSANERPLLPATHGSTSPSCCRKTRSSSSLNVH